MNGSLAAEQLACRRGERIVLRGVGFALGEGEALVVRGPNGSGKSSLLRVLAGLIEPAEGRLLRDGVDVAADPDRHRGRLAYLGHLDALKPDFTLRENVAAAAALAGADQSRVAAALDAYALLPVAAVPVRFLSQGQRRRAALARLAAAPAPLWLLDEPTAALDSSALGLFAAALDSHLARGGIAAVATHAELNLPRARTLTLVAPADKAPDPNLGGPPDALAGIPR